MVTVVIFLMNNYQVVVLHVLRLFHAQRAAIGMRVQLVHRSLNSNEKVEL